MIRSRKKKPRHHDGPPIQLLTLSLREELGVAWVHLKLENGECIEIALPWYLSQIIKVHAEAWLADHDSDGCSGNFAGYRDAKWFAGKVPAVASLPPERRAPYIRECRQDLRQLIANAVVQAGHKFRPPRIFEYKARLGTRLAAKEVVIRRIRASLDPPPGVASN